MIHTQDLTEKLAVAPTRRTKIRKSQAVATAILLAWVSIALLGDLITPYNTADFVSNMPFEPPSSVAWLGTDYMGRDLASRLIEATRLTLLMGISATGLAYLLGGTLGMFAALRGGWPDEVLSRTVDVLLSLPKKIAGLVIVASLGSSLSVLIAMTAIIYAASVFRFSRALANDVKGLDFVRAAQARGEGPIWLMFGEILPNIIMPLAADFAVRLGLAILFISGMSFLGLGVQAPYADWGKLVSENISGLPIGSWAPIIPAAAIASVTISLNLIVDSLGDRGRRAPL